MKQRKKCEICNEPLLSMEGHYFHPNKPCSGITDGCEFNVIVIDEKLFEIWEKQNGKPIMNDYERLNKLESNWLIKRIIRFIK